MDTRVCVAISLMSLSLLACNLAFEQESLELVEALDRVELDSNELDLPELDASELDLAEELDTDTGDGEADELVELDANPDGEELEPDALDQSEQELDEELPLVCVEPLVDCDGVCVSLGTNEHCAACGQACAQGTQCCRGECRSEQQLCEWWDPAFVLRGAILLEAAAEDVPEDYTACFTLPHESLLAMGAQEDGADLRVRRWDGGQWQAVDWVLDPESAFGTQDTQLCLRIVEPIAALQSDRSYYVYAGNPSAVAERHRLDAVFWAGDDFASGPNEELLSQLVGGYTTELTDGLLQLRSQNGSPNDCATFVVSRPLPHLDFVARARSRMTPLSSPASYRGLALAQSANAPTCSSPAWARYAIAMGTSRYAAFYTSTGGTQMYYDAPNLTWSTSAGQGQTYDASTWLQLRIESRDEQLRSRLFNEQTGVLTEVPWLESALMQDNGEPYWIAWGEVFTNQYLVQSELDWFTVSLELVQPPQLLFESVEHW